MKQGFSKPYMNLASMGVVADLLLRQVFFTLDPKKQDAEASVDGLVCHMTGLSSIEEEMKHEAHAVCAAHFLRIYPSLPYLDFAPMQPLMSSKEHSTFKKRLDLAFLLLNKELSLNGLRLVDSKNALRIEAISEKDKEYSAVLALSGNKPSPELLYCTDIHNMFARGTAKDRHQIFNKIHSPESPCKNAEGMTKVPPLSHCHKN